MPELKTGEIRVVLIALQGPAKEVTDSMVAQIKALFLAPNGVVCTKAAEAATASGD
jgi:hypothetical protein